LPDRVRGAVLLADVSGFTPLTVAAARELGLQRGAEEVTHHLGRIYGSLIAQVHRYLGSVISFAGDAITCWFDQDKGRRATACALAMQQFMTDYASLTTPAGTAIPFGIKIAVMAGAARRFVVGSPQVQMIDVLAGRLLERMAFAEQQLDSGEVVLGAEIMGELGNLAQVETWRATPQGESFALVTGLAEPVPPDPWPDLPPLAPKATRGWLLPSIRQRLVGGEALLLAELRTAIPCFLKFSGIDYDGDADACAKLDAFTRWVQTVAAHYEGHLAQLTMGDKGNCMYILFGAPVSHADDAARVVSAALELRAPPAELDFVRDIQIGVSQGQMYVGSYGGPVRRTYSGLGIAVNLASRLTGQAAPGQILVSKRIADAAEGAGYTFEPLEEIQFKGIPEPLTVFAASGKRRRRMGHLLRHRPSLPMVGREAERAVLSEQLRDLQAGQSGCCIVDGEAGIGKTRLVDDLREQAQALGVVTLVGAGDAVEHTTAYYAWRSIFRALFELDEFEFPSDRDEFQQQVLAYVEGDAYLAERIPLLDVVLPLNLPDNELTAQMMGEVRAENTREVLVRVLKRAQREAGSLLLVLDDAYWLDSASWALMAAVRQRVHPLLLVLAMRPLVETVPAEYEQLRSAQDARYLRLEVLPQDDIFSLVCQRLEARALTPGVAALIYEKAEGHPFFSEELACALHDTGLLDIDAEGTCCLSPTAGDGEALAFPDTIQAVITGRIDRLPPGQQVALKVASVIGRIFAFRILRAVYPGETGRPKLADYLDKLERREITLRHSPPPDLTYIFKHNITHQVAYNLMLFSHRRELHQQIARWYEQTFAQDLAPFYPLLAHHWVSAEETEKAFDYLEKAGEQALQSYVSEEAIAFFNQALALDDQTGRRVDTARRARWELRLGEAYINQSRHIESREHLVKGLAALGYPVPAGKVQPVVRLLGQLFRQVLHRLWPNRYVGRRADQKALLRDISRAHEKLAEVYVYTNEMLFVAYTVFTALNLAEVAGPCPELARGYVSVGGMMGLVPLHRQARAYVQRALDVALEVEDLSVQGHAVLYAGYYYAGTGDWDRTENLWNTALDIFDRLEERRSWESALGNLATVEYYRGNFARGLELADTVYLSACQRDDFFYQVMALTLKANHLNLLGKLAEVIACAESVQALLVEHTDIVDTEQKLMMYGELLKAYSQQAEYQKVSSTAQQVEDLLVEPQVIMYPQLSIYAYLTEAYLILWEVGYPDLDVKKLADKACKNLEKYARIFPNGRPRAWLCRGRYLWLASKTARARRLWQKSLAAAEQLAMPYERGLAHYEIGRRLGAGKPERAEHLQQALDIFDHLGAAPALKRAQAALDL
jgi:class 3 adenylate cyclase/tetratricopeptide (TPR) repeat protein